MAESKKAIKWVPILLVGLPLWIVASTGIGLWLWHKGDEATEEPAKYSTTITTQTVAANLDKFNQFVGPRHTASAAGQQGLTRTAAMIRGSLGPSNTGYQIQTVTAPPSGEQSWPIIIARLPGQSGHTPLWMVTAYDQSPDPSNTSDSLSNLVALIAVAQDAAMEKPRRPVYFVFLPHLYDENAPIAGTIQALQRFIDRHEPGGKIATVGPMHHPEKIEVSTPQSNSSNTPFSPLESLNLPIVHLSTPATDSSTPTPPQPDPQTITAASQQLATWLRENISPPTNP